MSSSGVAGLGPRDAAPWAALAAGLVLAACLAVNYATPGDSYWINDCGNKALLAERLHATGYRDADFSYAASDLDPELSWFPIPRPFAVTSGDSFVSAYPPAYAALAAPWLGSFGPRGLRFPAALGAAACAALFVFWTFSTLGRGAAVAGALVLGLGSPLYFYGVTVWEHSLTVALSLVAWVLIARNGSAIGWAIAGISVGAACWLREELVLMAVAILAAAVLRKERPRLWGAFCLGAGAVLLGLVIFNSGFYGHLLGGHVAANLGSDAERSVFAGIAPPDRLAAIYGLLGGWGRAVSERFAFVGIGSILLVVGWLAARRGTFGRWLAPLFAVAAAVVWLVAFVRIASDADPLRALVQHNGLLLQWPLLGLAGLGLHRAWNEPRYAAVRTGVLAGLLFAVSVLLGGLLVPSDFGVQVGAGVHWGPRVLLPALPALLLLSVAAVAVAAKESRRTGWYAWGALALACLLSSVLSVGLLAQQKSDGARFADRLRGLEPEIVITLHPLLAQHHASLWSDKKILLVADEESLRQARIALERAGVGELLFVVPPSAPAGTWLAGMRCTKLVEHRGRLHYMDSDVHRCVFAPGEGGDGSGRGVPPAPVE